MPTSRFSRNGITCPQKRRLWLHASLACCGLLMSVTAVAHAADTAPVKLSGHTDPVYAVAAVPGKPWIVTGSFDKTLKLWDAGTGKPIATLGGHTDLVLAIAVSPDGGMIASGSQDKTIKLWNVPAEPAKDPNEPLKPAKELKGHGSQVYGLAFSPDGKQLASCSADKTVRLWSVETGKETRKLPDQGDRFIRLPLVRMEKNCSPAEETKRCGCLTQPMEKKFANSLALEMPSIPWHFIRVENLSRRVVSTRRF